MCRCIFTGRRHLRKKHNKRPLQSARCVTTLKWAGTILTYAHIPSPHCVMAQIPQRCGRGYTKETAISHQHSAARHSNGDKPETAPQQYRDVTTIRQTRRLRVWRRQISRWRRLWSRQTGRETFPFIFFYCYSMSALTLAYFAIRYTYRTTVVLWYNGLCDIRVLYVHDATQCAWRRL